MTLPSQQPRPSPQQAAVCPVCRCLVEAGDAAAKCPDCNALYHQECWADNRGCGVYGCTQAPRHQPASALSAPASHWGREHKDCPQCGKQILAAAIRCRHCGETFPQADPESRSAFKRRKATEKSIPALKRSVIAISVLCWIPCTAPLAGAIGGLWYRLRRQDLKSLPHIYSALCRMAIGAAFAQTALLIIAGAIAALQ